MVDRVGDWYAFSRGCYCRRLTLYKDLQWRRPTHGSASAEVTDSAMLSSFPVATAELIALAPFGGPIAVLSRAADFTAGDAFSPSSPDGSSRPYFNLSTQSSIAAAPRAIHIFTNAGELLASFPLTSRDVGQGVVKTLGWTPEGELFFLLEPSLVVVFIDMRDVAVADVVDLSAASKTSSSSPATIASRRVSLRPQTDVAANRNAASSSPVTPIEAFCVTRDGLLCVDSDGSGQLYGILHEEKFRSSHVPPVRLPLHTFSSRTPGNLEGLGRTPSAAAWRPRVTAVDMVPPAWNDSGDFFVLWAQHSEEFPETKPHEREKVKEMESMLCAMVLPDGDVLAYGGSDYNERPGGEAAGTTTVSTVVPTWPAARITCAGRILNLRVCANDPTRVAAFTSLGVLHVFRSNLSSTLYSLDLGLRRVMRDIVLRTTHISDRDDAHNSGGGGFGSGGAQSPQSFAFGDVPWCRSDIDIANNMSFAGGGEYEGGGNIGASFRGSFAPMTDGKGGSAGHRSDPEDFTSTCISPCKLEWCGTNFVLLHFYQSDLQQPHINRGGSDGATTTPGLSAARQEAPMFSLLVCTQKGCTVHCERLDWSFDGSGHVVTVAEDDGVRVVSDTTCYLLQEVPSCLVKLCRVQPPFSAAAQVVLAYEAYMSGDRHGIAQVRAALSSSASTKGSTMDYTAAVAQEGEIEDDDDDLADYEGEMSYAEGIVYELLDAASYEVDLSQQYLLVAAASFAGETTYLRSGVPDVIVDVVRRLRVLRAMREEAGCHIPLTMGQYQVLNGSEERPARLLSSVEGFVIVDRLTYFGYYQLALGVVQVLHMKPNRMLSRWASSFVRRHAAAMSDAALHHEVTQVLKQYPAASYVEPSTTAFHLGRRDLALRLLRDEPQQQRQRVMLCVKMGELAMAGRAAAASGSAELIHLVVCALVAKEVQTQRGRSSSNRDGGGSEKDEDDEGAGRVSQSGVDVTADDVYHCLIASPELLCWLLVGAQWLALWQSMAQRLLFSHHWSLASLECQQMLVQCLRLNLVMHRTELKRLVAGTTATLGSLPNATEFKENVGGSAAGEERDEQRKSTKEGKKKKHRHHKKADGSGESGDDEAPDHNNDDGGGQGIASGSPAATSSAFLPLPFIPVPTAVTAAAALHEWMRKTNGALVTGLQHAEDLRREKSAARYPFSMVLESAERLRADVRKAATQGGDDGAQGPSRGMQRSPANYLGYDEESSGNVGNISVSSSVLAHEQIVRTILSTPSTTPQKDIAALKKEQELSRLKVSLAVKYNVPRLSRVGSVADLIYELCGIEDGEADAADVQRTFRVNEKIFFYTKLRGLCAAQRWDAVDRFLGPPPALQKRSFFSLSESDAVKTPCIGYLPVVQLLTEYKQEKRAARYVAGVSSETVDRVVLYMSLGAPVMALEAAMVDKDAGLIQQIMERVPGSAKVQSTGTQMLNELREG